MEVSERIRQFRKAGKISQERLAEALGVTRQAVSKWESGQSEPDVDRLVAISAVFGVTVDDLLTGAPPDAEAKAKRKRKAPADGIITGDTVRALAALQQTDTQVETPSVPATAFSAEVNDPVVEMPIFTAVESGAERDIINSEPQDEPRPFNPFIPLDDVFTPEEVEFETPVSDDSVMKMLAIGAAAGVVALVGVSALLRFLFPKRKKG